MRKETARPLLSHCSPVVQELGTGCWGPGGRGLCVLALPWCDGGHGPTNVGGKLQPLGQHLLKESNASWAV